MVSVFPDLFDMALPHLQHCQVVVGLSVMVVVDQGQPEALMGQIHVSYALKGKDTSACVKPFTDPFPNPLSIFLR